MNFVAKKDIRDAITGNISFTEGEKYTVVDVSKDEAGIKNFIVFDNQKIKNRISVNGDFINNFLIG